MNNTQTIAKTYSIKIFGNIFTLTINKEQTLDTGIKTDNSAQIANLINTDMLAQVAALRAANAS